MTVPKSPFPEGGQCRLGQLRLFMVSGPCGRENRWPRIESQTIPCTEVAAGLPTVDDGSTEVLSRGTSKQLGSGIRMITTLKISRELSRDFAEECFSAAGWPRNDSC